MDGLIEQILNNTAADEWLIDNHMGWLVSEVAINLMSIIIGSLILYYIGRVLITRGIRHLIRGAARHRSWHRKDIEKRQTTLIELMKSFWRIVVIAYVAAMVANKLFGFDLSPLLASAGIIGVAIGFGSQSLVKDFLSGVFIIAENQYRVGDIVDIMGAAGTVERVGMRSTVIRDADGNVHYIPNGSIQRVINKTMGYGIARFAVAIGPEVDVKKVTDIINKTGEKLAQENAWKKKIIDPPKFISIGEVTGNTVELTVSAKTMPSDQWAVTSEMRSRLLREFEAKEIPIISLPVPTSAK